MQTCPACKGRRMVQIAPNVRGIKKCELCKGTGQINDSQPKPVEGRQDVAPLVIADIQHRIELGVQKYGKPLQTFNGRNALQDAYEEVLDLAVYLKQRLLEESSP